MNAFEFNFIIIPLGTIVAVLVASVYYYAHREDMATRRTKKLICAYIKERARRLKIVNKEMARIDKLFKDASIDRQTCEHMKNMLVVIYEKESNEIATNIKINR